MSLFPSTASSQPMPAGPARLLCKLALMPLLTSSHLPLVRTAKLLLLALIADGSLAVATRVGHLLQTGAPPCLAPLSSRPATGAQLLVSARLHHGLPQQLHLVCTVSARPGRGLPKRIPGARCTLVQGLPPRSSPLLLPGRSRARLQPSDSTPGLLCCLLVSHLLMHSLHSLGRDPLDPCPMSRLHAVGYLRSRTPRWSWAGYPWTAWCPLTCPASETLLSKSEPRSRCMRAWWSWRPDNIRLEAAGALPVSFTGLAVLCIQCTHLFLSTLPIRMSH
jgi:hypothetical protein